MHSPTLPPEIESFDGLIAYLLDRLSDDDAARAQDLFLEYEAKVIELTTLRVRWQFFLELRYTVAN